MTDLPEREPVSEVESLLRTTGHYGRADCDEPIDFALVHADDEFLDALGGAHPDRVDRLRDDRFRDDKLAELLLAWRRDVDAEPIGDVVDPPLAVVTVRAARARQRRGPRLLAPLAAAAAVLAIAFAGVGLAARDAEPGDTLWGLTRVLYADHARSVEAAYAVRTDLRGAEEALASGKVAEAKTMLDQIRHALPTVASEDGQADLRAQHDALAAKIPDNPAVGAAPPPAAAPSTAPSVLPPSSSLPSSTTQSPSPTSGTSVGSSPTSTVPTGPGGGGGIESTNADPTTPTEPAAEPNTDPQTGQSAESAESVQSGQSAQKTASGAESSEP